MKKFSIIVMFGIFSFLLVGCGSKSADPTQEVFEKTMEISKQYISLRIQTDEVLINAKNIEYQSWQDTMTNILDGRANLEKNSIELQKLADQINRSDLSFSFGSQVYAYDKQEISDIFDKAPAGKKIATLAKHLGVDAKLAFKILKQDQAQVEADARNEAGDTFQKLETSATVIKDGCKIAGFVGGIVIAGGPSAIIAGSTLGQATVIVGGADLVLEVTDDAAKIALGNHNKISALASSLRTVTEPLASILTITDIPNNLKNGYEKFSAVMVGLDQFNSAAQDGKIVGVQLPAYQPGQKKSEVQVSTLEPQEIGEWLEKNNTSLSKEQALDLQKIQELLTIVKQENINIQEESVDEPQIIEDTTSDSLSAVGSWKGVGTSKESSVSDYENINWDITLKKDGTIQGAMYTIITDGMTRTQEGNSVKIYGEEPNEGYYDFLLEGNTLTFIKMAGRDSEGKRSEVLAGSDFFGGVFFEVTLTRSK